MLTTEKQHVTIFVTMVTHVRDVFVNFGQKYAEIGIELSLANVLDNFSFYFKSLAKKRRSYKRFSK